VTKDHSIQEEPTHPEKPNTSQKPSTSTYTITCGYYLLYHLANLLQKIIASIHRKLPITCAAIIFSRYLANLLQKIIALSGIAFYAIFVVVFSVANKKLRDFAPTTLGV
jgi:hypothetical protein